MPRKSRIKPEERTKMTLAMTFEDRRRARILAAEKGISVSDMVHNFLDVAWTLRGGDAVTKKCEER